MNADVAQRQALAALCYFDLFAKPLTAFEVWWNLARLDEAARDGGDVFSQREIADVMRDLAVRGVVGEKWGFYFLPGHEENVVERRVRFLIGKKKWDRAVRAARLIRWVPFLRMTAVCNTLAIDAARDTSDIDFLVVAARGRLWLTRLLVTSVIQLFGLRRHGSRVADRICLSFYLTDELASLDLSRILLTNMADASAEPLSDDVSPDMYLTYYATQVVSLFDVAGTRDAFFVANSWARRVLPNAAPPEIAWPRRVLDSRLTRATRHAFERVLCAAPGAAAERLAKKIQTRHMRDRDDDHVHAKTRSISGVVISDTMLKFHEQDRRAYFAQEFGARYRAACEALAAHK